MAQGELDTVADFVAYLRAKEKLFTRCESILIDGGEENLLGLYLNENRSFIAMEISDLSVIDSDIWASLTSKPEFVAKKEADRISYVWDSIINRAHEGGTDYELVARELARPNRFQRRINAKAFMDAHASSHSTGKPIRRLFPVDESTTYCFLFEDDSSPDRGHRKGHLAGSCFVARGAVGTRKVVGVATEIGLAARRSYDFVLLDLPNWTPEHDAQAERIRETLGILTTPQVSRFREQEYPHSE